MPLYASPSRPTKISNMSKRKLTLLSFFSQQTPFIYQCQYRTSAVFVSFCRTNRRAFPLLNIHRWSKEKHKNISHSIKRTDESVSPILHPTPPAFFHLSWMKKDDCRAIHRDVVGSETKVWSPSWFSMNQYLGRRFRKGGYKKNVISPLPVNGMVKIKKIKIKKRH